MGALSSTVIFSTLSFRLRCWQRGGKVPYPSRALGGEWPSLAWPHRRQRQVSPVHSKSRCLWQPPHGSSLRVPVQLQPGQRARYSTTLRSSTRRMIISLPQAGHLASVVPGINLNPPPRRTQQGQSRGYRPGAFEGERSPRHQSRLLPSSPAYSDRPAPTARRTVPPIIRGQASLSLDFVS